MKTFFFSPYTVRLPPHSFFKLVMVFHGHDDDAGEEDQVRPSERAESDIWGDQRGGGHQEDADPDSEKPDQADVIRGFSFDDPEDERNIKKGQEDPRPGTKMH